MTIYFLPETIKTRRKWQIIFQVLKRPVNCGYLVKVFFRDDAGDKNIPRPWKTIEELSTSIPPIKDWLNEVLQTEGK